MNKRYNIIGCDPGKTGGIACLHYVVGEPVHISILILEAATRQDVYTFLDARSPGVAYLELVKSSTVQSQAAAFEFGRQSERIAMGIVSAGLRMEEVRPQKWQSVLRLPKIGGGYGKNDTKKKRRNRERAQELYPEIRCTNAISDALLLAEYGRIVENAARPVSPTCEIIRP